jgi:N utilization substance protein A
MTAEELDEVIDKAVKTFEKIEGVDTELAERLVEQGILSYDDLSVMEIADLVNTIEGLSEEQATEIVSQAEILAEEQSDDLPRRKGGRAAAALLEAGPAAEDRPHDGGEGPGPDGLEAGEELAGSAADEHDPTLDHPEAILGDSTGTPGSALPSEPDDAVGDDLPLDESTDSEADEASDDEIHDLALAAEKSGRSPQGHEVTSRPRDDDQGESIRIVTEAVESGVPGRPAGSSPPQAGAGPEPARPGQPRRPGDEGPGTHGLKPQDGDVS